MIIRTSNASPVFQKSLPLHKGEVEEGRRIKNGALCQKRIDQ